MMVFNYSVKDSFTKSELIIYDREKLLFQSLFLNSFSLDDIIVKSMDYAFKFVVASRV